MKEVFRDKISVFGRFICLCLFLYIFNSPNVAIAEIDISYILPNMNSYKEKIKQTLDDINKQADERAFEDCKRYVATYDSFLEQTKWQIIRNIKEDPNFTPPKLDIKIQEIESYYNALKSMRENLMNRSKEILDKYSDLSKKLFQNRLTQIDNIGKAMVKYGTRIGKPKITDINVSDEVEDAEALKKNFDILWKQAKENKNLEDELTKLLSELKTVDKKFKMIQIIFDMYTRLINHHREYAEGFSNIPRPEKRTDSEQQQDAPSIPSSPPLSLTLLKSMDLEKIVKLLNAHAKLLTDIKNNYHEISNLFYSGRLNRGLGFTDSYDYFYRDDRIKELNICSVQLEIDNLKSLREGIHSYIAEETKLLSDLYLIKDKLKNQSDPILIELTKLGYPIEWSPVYFFYDAIRIMGDEEFVRKATRARESLVIKDRNYTPASAYTYQKDTDRLIKTFNDRVEKYKKLIGIVELVISKLINSLPTKEKEVKESKRMFDKQVEEIENDFAFLNARLSEFYMTLEKYKFDMSEVKKTIKQHFQTGNIGEAKEFLIQKRKELIQIYQASEPITVLYEIAYQTIDDFKNEFVNKDLPFDCVYLGYKYSKLEELKEKMNKLNPPKGLIDADKAKNFSYRNLTEITEFLTMFKFFNYIDQRISQICRTGTGGLEQVYEELNEFREILDKWLPPETAMGGYPVITQKTRDICTEASIRVSKREEEEKKKIIIQLIHDFYNKFKSAYESRNDSLVMSFLGDGWSAGDGTTLADLHENLRRAFKTYNEIRFNLQNLQIIPVGPQRYQVSYDVTITSRIYSLDIKHEEKSSVVEEVTLENPNKPKISRTISGRFWYIE